MDELRSVYLHIGLLEFENALAAICAIFKMEKKFSKAEISEVVEAYFKIPKELKIGQLANLKKLLKIFFQNQMSSLNLVQKKMMLQDYQSLNEHDLWSAQEYIGVCLELGEIEAARAHFCRIIDEAFSYKRLSLIEAIIERFHDLIDACEHYRIKLICACMRHDKALVELMYKQSLDNNEKRIIFRKVIEVCPDSAIIMPESLEIGALELQLSKKMTLASRKNAVNKLYEFLAISADKNKILLLCAGYFIKVKRKKVAQKVVDFIKTRSPDNLNIESAIREIEEKINKEKEDNAFPLEKDELFDLAEDLFSGEISEIFKDEKKTKYALDLSLMGRDVYMIRQGLLSIDEIANEELKNVPLDTKAQNRKIEKAMANAFMNIEMPVKRQLHRDLVSALIMLEMLESALQLCEELMPELPGIEDRISISYLIVIINFKKENYDRVISLCNGAVASLPLSGADKIAFLRLMAASFRKKGEIKHSIGVDKLIDKLMSAANEVQE
ncbi:MAG: hypothetical protein A2X86_05795 [Bdellovibrionales bacterium GWA2_49_15]|nr:MAG: hypothetical protein A2X86_05795 [Bdellovibrionales bacterium GWA2_49_15]